MGKEHHNDKFKKNSKKKTRSKDKHIFCIGSSKQLSDYENTSQCLISDVKKEWMRGNDMSEALHNLTCPIVASQEPTLEMSVETDIDAKARGDKQNDLKCKMECDACLKRNNSFEENEHKACTDT